MAYLDNLFPSSADNRLSIDAASHPRRMETIFNHISITFMLNILNMLWKCCQYVIDVITSDFRRGKGVNPD